MYVEIGTRVAKGRKAELEANKSLHQPERHFRIPKYLRDSKNELVNEAAKIDTEIVEIKEDEYYAIMGRNHCRKQIKPPPISSGATTSSNSKLPRHTLVQLLALTVSLLSSLWCNQ